MTSLDLIMAYLPDYDYGTCTWHMTLIMQTPKNQLFMIICATAKLTAVIYIN